ncbi:ubiquitin carboxyl-terminal hydrolase [Podila humilis]|nr:ubiquitin carboxyl-terminal hydrolase [Podila humilis]
MSSSQQPHPLPLGGGWCTLESTPLVFNALLQKNGVRGTYAQEMYSLDPMAFEQLEQDGGQLYGFILLLEPQNRLSRTVEPESGESGSDSESESESNTTTTASSLFHTASATATTATTTAATTATATTSIPSQKKAKTKNKRTQVYFANQVIPNACATQAILSVVMNAPPSLDLGPVLHDFRDFTKDFDSMNKGLAMTNCKSLRENHNNLARRLEREPSCLNQYLYNAELHESTEESTFHYITYVPINGHIWELDGLEPAAIRRSAYACNKDSEGGCPSGDWLTVAGEVMTSRIMTYPKGEERFVLFTIMKDPLLVAEEKLAGEKLKEARGDQTLPQLSPSSLPSSTSMDRILQLEQEVSSLQKQRAEEKVDMDMQSADFFPAIHFLLQHLLDSGKLDPKTSDALIAKKTKLTKEAPEAVEETKTETADEEETAAAEEIEIVRTTTTTTTKRKTTSKPTTTIAKKTRAPPVSSTTTVPKSGRITKRRVQEKPAVSESSKPELIAKRRKVGRASPRLKKKEEEEEVSLAEGKELTDVETGDDGQLLDLDLDLDSGLVQEQGQKHENENEQEAQAEPDSHKEESIEEEELQRDDQNLTTESETTTMKATIPPEQFSETKLELPGPVPGTASERLPLDGMTIDSAVEIKKEVEGDEPKSASMGHEQHHKGVISRSTGDAHAVDRDSRAPEHRAETNTFASWSATTPSSTSSAQPLPRIAPLEENIMATGGASSSRNFSEEDVFVDVDGSEGTGSPWALSDSGTLSPPGSDTLSTPDKSSENESPKDVTPSAP